MDKFMSGLADMMSGPQLDGGMDSDQEQEGEGEPQDMNAFRESLIRQNRCNSSSSGVSCNLLVEYALDKRRSVFVAVNGLSSVVGHK